MLRYIVIVAISLGLLALLIIYLEFYLPGGLMAVLGSMMAFAAIAMSLYSDPKLGVIFSICELIAVGITIGLALKHVKKHLDLSNTQEGYVSCSFNEEYVGREAVVVKDLRPSGFIEIDGVLCQALSKGQYLKKNTKVKIIDGQGSHFIVR